MTWRNILTAAEMRAAEERAIAGGTSVEALMERAGAGAAEAIRRFAGPMPTLVLCGPGNNGGDGYVIARTLREWGWEVRVAALAEPQSEAARAAAERWGRTLEPFASTEPAPLLIDALFGTGLRRPLDEAISERLAQLASAAHVRVAIDLPSGAATDDGALLSPAPECDLSVTFGALKPSHLLQPAARHLGRLVIVDIGIESRSRLWRIGPPQLARPGPDDHKYSRGYVAVLAGEMPGAAALTASAALRAGAGYVRLVAEAPVAGCPKAVVQSHEGLDDPRTGAIAVGPGLGRGGQARRMLEAAFATGHPLVLDADALQLIDGKALARARHMPILTPHAGEFERLFGHIGGSKVERARNAAALAGAVVLLKGADTVVAAPDGRAAIAPPASSWLATAGTGDVLAGIIAAMRAQRLGPLDAACAGTWLQARAAEIAGPHLIADDLVRCLPEALRQAD